MNWSPACVIKNRVHQGAEIQNVKYYTVRNELSEQGENGHTV